MPVRKIFSNPAFEELLQSRQERADRILAQSDQRNLRHQRRTMSLTHDERDTRMEDVGSDHQEDQQALPHGTATSDSEESSVRINTQTTPTHQSTRPQAPIPTPRRISQPPIVTNHPDQQPISTINALFKTNPFDERYVHEWLRLLDHDFVMFGVHNDSLKITLMKSCLPRPLERKVTRELALLRLSSFDNACKILLSWCNKTTAQRIHELDALPKSLGALMPSDLMGLIQDVLEQEPFSEEHLVFFLKRLPDRTQRRHQLDNIPNILLNPIAFSRLLDEEVKSNARIDAQSTKVSASRQSTSSAPSFTHRAESSFPQRTPAKNARPSSSKNADKYLCFYHKKFGTRAQGCGKHGCTWFQRVAALQQDSFTDYQGNE